MLAWILASLTQAILQTRHGPLLLGVSVRVGQQKPASETPAHNHALQQTMRVFGDSRQTLDALKPDEMPSWKAD